MLLHLLPDPWLLLASGLLALAVASRGPRRRRSGTGAAPGTG